MRRFFPFAALLGVAFVLGCQDVGTGVVASDGAGPQFAKGGEPGKPGGGGGSGGGGNLATTLDPPESGQADRHRATLAVSSDLAEFEPHTLTPNTEMQPHPPENVGARSTPHRPSREARLTSATSGLGPDELERLRAGLEILALRSLRDREAAEEAVQETLTRAVEASKQGRIKNPEKLGAFVRGIARNVIADMIRARKHTTGLEALARTPSDPDSDALSLIISKQQREQLRVALADLSATDQEILHLSFFEGLTPAEIADRLNEPAERIRKRKSRALLRL